MNHLYLLRHHHILGEDVDTKLIGVFNSSKQVKNALREYKKLRGFCETKDGFEIIKIRLDQIYYD
jgi:hypothetical protein